MKLSITLNIENASAHQGKDAAFLLRILADRLEPQPVLRLGETRAILDLKGDRAGECKTHDS